MNNMESVQVEKVFKENFIDYGMEVIKNRALPDVRDGLKPVQRNALYEYYVTGATSKASTVKMARLSGSIIGKWHPHGDAAVEEALVNMSQEWKNNLPLIYIKGNNGSIYGDAAAAGRYIESRTTIAGDLLGEWLSPEIVPFVPNYDDTEQMPTILPAQVPVLLINGTNGIAVGLASYLPPHNVADVMDTVIYYIQHPKATTEELLGILKGPDFPTGGTIINQSELKDMYETGRGRVRIRGTMYYDAEEHAFHVTEVPYTKSGSVDKLIAEIALATMETTDKKGKKKPPKIAGVAEVENHSGKNGIDIKISLRANVEVKQIKQQLYAMTGLEDTMPVDFKALNEKVVARYTLKKYLREYVDYQEQLILKKYAVEKRRIEQRMEIVSGRIILQKVINEVIACAKVSKGRKHLETILTNGDVPEGLPKQYHPVVSLFQFTQRQAEDIAGLAIYRISQMDMQQLVKEGRQLQKEWRTVENVLTSKARRQKLMIKRHEQTKQAYQSERKTQITNQAFATPTTLTVPETPLFVALDQYHYLRIQEKSFEQAKETTNQSRLGVFDKQGVMWYIHLDQTKCTQGRGILLNQWLPGVEVVDMVCLPQDEELLFVYQNGYAKRCLSKQYWTKTRATKVASGKLKEGNQLIAVKAIPKGAHTVLLNGKAFSLTQIPLQSIQAGGHRCIEETTTVDVQFSVDKIETPKTERTQQDAWCVFYPDGKCVFDWSMGAKPEGLYVTTYQQLLQTELVIVHTDGTAKRIDGTQFAVKTKRSQIKANKEGKTILYMQPVTETLLATYDSGKQKHIRTSDISKQGKSGGGIQAFVAKKQQLQSIQDGKDSSMPLMTLAMVPR